MAIESPRDAKMGPSLRPVKHATYYLDQVTFRIDNTLYGIPTAFLRRSSFFVSMLDNIHTGGSSEGVDDNNPIMLSAVTATEMDSFLAVVDSRCIDGQPKFTIEEWSAALHLATMWHFDAARKYIINQISSHFPKQNALDRIDLATKCQVGHWLHPAYQALCEREEPLTADEMPRLSYAQLTAICRIREALYKRSTNSGKTIYCGSCYYCRNGNSYNCQDQTTPAAMMLEQIQEAKELAVPFEKDGETQASG